MKIIEFLGSPRAGKTEQITRLAKYFEKLGIKYGIITDREIEKEISVSFEEAFEYNLIFFNKIFEKMHALKKECEIIILDRGFLDAEAWINVEHKRENLSRIDRIKILDYLDLLQKKYVDLAIFMMVDPKTTFVRHEEKKEQSNADDYAMNKEYINNLHEIYSSMANYHKTNEKVFLLDGKESMEFLESSIISKINKLLEK